AIRTIREAGQQILDVTSQEDPFPPIREELFRSQAEGVVILGGYDVLKALRYDTIPPAIRQQLGGGTEDSDDFVVWSDQAYGDRDGDMMGEVPVSRIADGRSSELVKRALGATASTPQKQRFGLRNHARPFADPIFSNVLGAEPILVSEPSTPSKLN